MPKFFKSALFLFAVCALFFTAKASSHAASAELSFSPIAQRAYVGREITVWILVDTQGSSANVVTADFAYPYETLELVNIDTANSVFSSSAILDSSEVGYVRISRHAEPKESFKGEGQVCKVTFKVLAEGEVYLKFADTASVVADGGTEILATKSSTYIDAVKVLGPDESLKAFPDFSNLDADGNPITDSDDTDSSSNYDSLSGNFNYLFIGIAAVAVIVIVGLIVKVSKK